jgi:hypothetical protein
VSPGDVFAVDLVLEAYASPPYVHDWIGYQLIMSYDDTRLTLVGLPSSWANAPTATTSGNLRAFPNGAACVPPDTGNTFTPTGLAMGCIDAQASASVSDSGPLVRLFFQCHTAGTTTLVLEGPGPAGTHILDGDFEDEHPATLNSASVTCGDVEGSPGTPAPTNTPALSTPAGTATVPAPGTDDAAVFPPGTGSGALVDSNGATLLLLGLVVAFGCVLLATGAVALQRWRR